MVRDFGCVFAASILARIRRWSEGKIVSTRMGVWHLILGATPLGMVTAMLIMGYAFSPGR
jgi:hypothetical protein